MCTDERRLIILIIYMYVSTCDMYTLHTSKNCRNIVQVMLKIIFLVVVCMFWIMLILISLGMCRTSSVVHIAKIIVRKQNSIVLSWTLFRRMLVYEYLTSFDVCILLTSFSGEWRHNRWWGWSEKIAGMANYRLTVVVRLAAACGGAQLVEKLTTPRQWKEKHAEKVWNGVGAI